MDSLLATYASSSDDEEDQPHHHHSNSNSNHNHNHNHHETSSFSASLEPSSSSSSSTNLFNLPQPKSSPSSSLFSSMLPPPKSNQPIRQQPSKNLSSSNQNPKKIVQFRPPLNPSLLKTLNDEDSDEEEEKSRKPIKVSSTETSSVASFFSSLPAPKSSLGLGSGSSLGAGRKSIIHTNALPSSNSNDTRVEKKKIELCKKEEEGNLGSGSSSMTTASEALISGGDGSNWVSSNENYGSYENYGGYVNYENSYGTYEGSYGGSGVDMASTTMEQPTMMIPEFSRAVENVARSQGKRGRNDIPTEIIEVRQDELMKNRPREDQAKMTGIAFGPAYQPASSKGQPSKLHKRKHQIGALYFDMRQKETELSERRSKGFLTKAETQAKYGW